MEIVFDRQLNLFNLGDTSGFLLSLPPPFFFSSPCNLNFLSKTLHSFLSPKQFPLASRSITVNVGVTLAENRKMYEARTWAKIANAFAPRSRLSFLIISTIIGTKRIENGSFKRIVLSPCFYQKDISFLFSSRDKIYPPLKIS